MSYYTNACGRPRRYICAFLLILAIASHLAKISILANNSLIPNSLISSSCQIDAVSFTLSSIATVANAYGEKGVVDKALLGRLAGILQQMDGKVVSGPEAVQDVSMILNAYARADMRETALSLSHTLTNHLKPHVGGLTAQAMANIVLRVGVA